MKFYKCPICGNVIVIHEGNIEHVRCCGKELEELIKERAAELAGVDTEEAIEAQEADEQTEEVQEPEEVCEEQTEEVEEEEKDKVKEN